VAVWPSFAWGKTSKYRLVQAVKRVLERFTSVTKLEENIEIKFVRI
jgi:hypothetical protein